MKVRVLYPTVVDPIVGESTGGKIINLREDLAKALIAEGAVEEVRGHVEQATAAPGEKRKR